MTTSSQDVFGRYMIFNLASVIKWKVITAQKQHQVDIDYARKNSKQVRFEYTVGNLVYVGISGIYHKIDYNKYGPYKITKVFLNNIFQLQK